MCRETISNSSSSGSTRSQRKVERLYSTVTQRTDLQTLCWAHTHKHLTPVLHWVFAYEAHTVAAKHIYFGFDFAFTYGKWTRTQYIHLTQDIMMQRSTPPHLTPRIAIRIPTHAQANVRCARFPYECASHMIRKWYTVVVIWWERNGQCDLCIGVRDHIRLIAVL